MTHVSRPATGATRRRDPRATRDRLVRAALELFTTRGYHATTTPQIAARAAVAEGTIYRHFDSKEHLLNEIFRAAIRLLSKPVEESPPDAPCRERLARVAGAWREVARMNPPLIRLVFQHDIQQLLDPRSRDSLHHFKMDLEKIIAGGKSTGDVRTGAAEVWTDVWLRLVVLVLDRTASGDWPLQHPGAQLVLDSAWDAIATPRSS